MADRVNDSDLCVNVAEMERAPRSPRQGNHDIRTKRTRSERKKNAPGKVARDSQRSASSE